MAAIHSIFQDEKEIISIDIFGSIRKWQIETGKFSISAALDQESNVFGAVVSNEKIFISFLDRIDIFSVTDFSRISAIETDTPGLIKSTSKELILGTSNIWFSYDLDTLSEKTSRPGNIRFIFLIIIIKKILKRAKKLGIVTSN